MFYIFEDELQTEHEWEAYSDTPFTYWSCSDWPLNCEPDDHGNNRVEQDCIALYNSREYNLSDWECNVEDQHEAWSVNNVLCRNLEYHPEWACSCECDVCDVVGDPHVTTLDGTYYHPMVCHFLLL